MCAKLKHVRKLRIRRPGDASQLSVTPRSRAVSECGGRGQIRWLNLRQTPVTSTHRRNQKRDAESKEPVVGFLTAKQKRRKGSGLSAEQLSPPFFGAAKRL